MKDIELINASAGSGKTYSLTSRVVEKIQSGIAPEGLMATTFTNKAAAELRERIRLRLLDEDRPDEAQRVFDGFVGTVDSICAGLLKEYALDAGLSPNLDVLPKEDAGRLFQIAIAAMIDDHADALEPVARRLGRDGGGVRRQKRPDWRDDVQAIVAMARANLLDGDDLSECARKSWDSLRALFGEPLAADSSRLLDEAVQDAITALELIDEPKTETKKSLEALNNFSIARRRGLVVPWSEWARLAKIKPNVGGKGLVDDVNRIAGDVLKQPKFQADVEEMIKGVFDCAGEGLQSYEAYKQKQGLMDFIDQEVKVLEMAVGNDAFRASMRDRLRQMMVDEFQDTSPIQLALFLALNELAGQSIWVGDPKQSIYGFRGTDPQLMDEVTKQLRVTQTLDKSWRSREVLVRLSNAVFSEVFHEAGAQKVCLTIPDARRDAAEGGWLESWNLVSTKIEDDASAIAIGVKDLLSRREDIKPGDLAILSYTNKQCADIAKSLEALGIRASAAQGSLMATDECRLAIAALRYMQDRRDKVALAEVVHLSPRHADHGRWLAELMLNKDDATAEWMNDPLIAALEQAREGLNYRTPLEALELAIDRADLLNTIKSWSNATLRMSNLDALRRVCGEYLDQCRARRGAATVAGFIACLLDANPGQAQGIGEQTVQVQTYHGAKGLEWPVVILAGLDTKFKPRTFGANVVPAPKFDPAKPLADRSIRFWPWPFGAQSKIPMLDDRLKESAEDKSAREQARREAQRLMYVGMTRARDGMVFAMRKAKPEDRPKTAWLDELTDKDGNPLLSWPQGTGDQVLKIGDCSIPITVPEYLPKDEAGRSDTDGKNKLPEPDNYLAPAPIEARDYPPARLAPSDLIADDGAPADICVEQVADLGQRIEIRGNLDKEIVALLGNAIHGYLGIDYPALPADQQLDIATKLLRRWGVEGAMNPADLLTAGARLTEFIAKNYPGAKVLREWPITLRNADGQLIQGWVDMLL